MIRVFFKILKTEGALTAVQKTFHYIVALIKKKIQRAPIFFYYWKLKILKSIAVRCKERTIKILGFQIHYSDLRSLYMEFKDIFKNQIYCFYSECDSPLIIDGGGFIGISALYFKWLYPNANILVYEPNEHALEFLQKNISENKLNNIEVRKVGLSSNSGSTVFSDDGTDGGKISEHGSMTIRTEKLSDAISNPVDFVKLNIEGAELDVLTDLDKTDKFRYIQELCFEWHSFSRNEQNLDECLAILKKNGYRYLINHFDYITNQAVRPPFHMDSATQYYLLVYAKKIHSMDKK